QRDGRQKKDKTVSEELVLRNAINVNSDGFEFAPVRYENGLVFVSSRRKAGPIDKQIGERFFELYYAELDPDGMPRDPELFSLQLNSQVHENSVTFDPDAGRIYFTRSNLEKGLTQADAQGKIGMKIYAADKGEFDWENIRELSFNSNDYSSMHPTLTPDGSKLFFASDKSGGYGGMDLYFVERESDEEWSEPINLGPEINTTGNEVFPFYHPSGVLYFSSDSRDGMGGLDLYSIDISSNVWGEVVHMESPFNSEGDDLGFYLNDDGASGYFSSNREGGLGKDDIYVFQSKTFIQENEYFEDKKMIFAVYDQSTGQPLDDATLRILERGSGSAVGDEDLYDLELLPSGEGDGTLRLKFVRKREAELQGPKFVTDPEGKVEVDVLPTKDYVLFVTKAGYETKEITLAANEITPGDPYQVQLGEDDCFNLDGVVVSNPYEKTIPNARVRIINECDGTEEILRTNINGSFSYCLNPGCDYTIIGEKQGYRSGTSEISTVRVRGSRSLAAELELIPETDVVLKEPIRRGTVILLENIYYDFNKSSIRSGETRDLEALVTLMKKYPTMQIELGAHTDARGSDDYNMNLSLRRAESAKRFLVERGIAPHRVKPFGYGETQLRNQCDDGVSCSEEEHQYNRRTEVKVIDIDEPFKIQYK
ncbi:MAG: OmpA family protein, partial [Saprospiraceae bacterium]|nr:OmpA family protein [Saprospiraceae bacterium]